MQQWILFQKPLGLSPIVISIANLENGYHETIFYSLIEKTTLIFFD